MKTGSEIQDIRTVRISISQQVAAPKEVNNKKGGTASEEKLPPGKHAFFGKCMAVVRAGAASGMLKLTVSAENLPDAECTIEIK